MKPLRITLLPLLLAAMTACGPADYRTGLLLDRVEDLLWTHADSALALIESHEPAPLTGRKTRARYNLLTVQCRSRCRLAAENDSLITSALEYYLRRPSVNPEELFRTYLYYGDVLLDLGNHLSAVEQLKQAELLLPPGVDHRYTCLLYANLGFANRKAGLLQQALDYHGKAYAHARRSGDREWQLTAVTNMMNLPGYEETPACRDYPPQLVHRHVKGLPARLAAKLWQNTGLWYATQHDTLKAQLCYEETLKLDPTLNSTRLTLAAIYDNSGQTALADSLYDIIMEEGSLAQQSLVHFRRFNRYHRAGQPAAALPHYEKYLHTSARVIKNREDKEIMELQFKYARLAENHRTLQIYFILAILLTASILVSAVIYHILRRKLRKQRMIVQYQQTALYRLDQDRREQQQESNRQQKQLNQYRTICRMTGSENLIRTRDLSAVNLALRLQVPDARLTPQDHSDVLRWCNMAYNGYANRLKARYGGLSVTDLVLCCLLTMRFSIPKCAQLLGVEPATVQKRIQRMTNQLKMSSRQEFLTAITTGI